MKDAEVKNSTSSITAERGSFVIGLSASLLALYPFKESLDTVFIKMPWFSITFYNSGLLFLSLLLFSAYIHGLNNIRYSIPKIVEWKLFRFLELGAILMYVSALLLPIIFFIAWLAIYLFNFLPFFTKNYLITSNIISTLVAILGMLLSKNVSERLYKNNLEAVKEEIETLSVDLKVKLESTYKKDNPKLSLLIIFESIMSSLRSRLVIKIGLNAKDIPDYQVIKISKDLGMLSAKEELYMNKVRFFRNELGHNSNNEINSLIKLLNPVLNRIINKDND